MYKKYINKRGKRIGPYYYSSIRQANGRVKSIYLGSDPKKAEKKLRRLRNNYKQKTSESVPQPIIAQHPPRRRTRSTHFSLFRERLFIAFFLLLMLFGFLYFGNVLGPQQAIALTGTDVNDHVIQHNLLTGDFVRLTGLTLFSEDAVERTYTEPLSALLNTSTSYSFTLSGVEHITRVAINGNIMGDLNEGDVKVFLESESLKETYLVFSSDSLLIPPEEPRSLFKDITGAFVQEPVPLEENVPVEPSLLSGFSVYDATGDVVRSRTTIPETSITRVSLTGAFVQTNAFVDFVDLIGNSFGYSENLGAKGLIEPENVSFLNAFGFDFSNVTFVNATLNISSEADYLYKCSFWDFELKICLGEWEFLVNVSDLPNYTLMLEEEAVGFAEGIFQLEEEKLVTPDVSEPTTDVEETVETQDTLKTLANLSGITDFTLHSFEDVCDDTCSIRNFFAGDYQLKIFVQGLVFELDSLIFTVSENATTASQYSIMLYDAQGDVLVTSQPVVPVPTTDAPVKAATTFINDSVVSRIVGTNYTAEITQYGAVINKPVQWKKKITFNDTVSAVAIPIPEVAENVTVTKILDDIPVLVEQPNQEPTIPLTGAVVGFPLTGFAVRESTTEQTDTPLELSEIETAVEEGGITTVLVEEVVEEVEVFYETPGPVATEEQTAFGKRIVVSSEIHYKNILTFTSLPDIKPETANLYRIVDGSRVAHAFTAYDTNNNGDIDYIEWITPSLSNETFEIDLVILNIQSYPIVGGEWAVNFVTTGTANLTITASNGTTWSDTTTAEDLKFLQLECGSTVQPYEWINDQVFVENYYCNETSKERSTVLTSGKHTLRFQFGDIVKYAHNLAATRSTGVLAETGMTPVTATSTSIPLKNAYNISKAFISTRFSGNLSGTTNPDFASATVTWGGDTPGIQIDINRYLDTDDLKVSWSILQADNIDVRNFTHEWVVGASTTQENVTITPALPDDFSTRCFVEMHRNTRYNSSDRDCTNFVNVLPAIINTTHLRLYRQLDASCSIGAGEGASETSGFVVCFNDGTNVTNVNNVLPTLILNRTAPIGTAVNTSNSFIAMSFMNDNDGIANDQLRINFSDNTNLNAHGGLAISEQRNYSAYVVQFENDTGALVQHFSTHLDDTIDQNTHTLDEGIDPNKTLLSCQTTLRSGTGNAHQRGMWVHNFTEENDGVVSTKTRTTGAGQDADINCQVITWPTATTSNILPFADSFNISTTDATKNDTAQNLTLTYNITDFNDDIVTNITDWRRENVSLAILHMPFDTNISDDTTHLIIRDYTTYYNNGTLGGGAAADVPAYNTTETPSGCVKGGCYEFDGENSRIEIPHNLSLNLSLNSQDFTIMFWTKFANMGQKNNFPFLIQKDVQISGQRNSDFTLSFSNSSKKVACAIWVDDTSYNVQPAKNDWVANRWYHLGCTFDRDGGSNNLRFYVDGVNEKNATQDIDLPGVNVNVTLAERLDGNQFFGAMDEIYIFNRTLSASEVKWYFDNDSLTGLPSSFTTRYDNWTACLTPNDQFTDGNTTCETITLLNAVPPVPVLVRPLDANTTHNLTVTFHWDESIDDDGDEVNYTLNHSCILSDSGCSADNQEYEIVGNTTYCDGTACNFTITTPLSLFHDDSNRHNWTVRATDSLDNSSFATTFRLNMTVLTAITFTNAAQVLFDALTIGQNEDTKDNDPNPFHLRNDGNSLIDINITTGDSLWTSSSFPLGKFNFSVADPEDKLKCEPTLTYTSATTTTTAFSENKNFSLVRGFNDFFNEDEFDVEITIAVPDDEVPGNKESNITFFAYYSGGGVGSDECLG